MLLFSYHSKFSVSATEGSPEASFLKFSAEANADTAVFTSLFLPITLKASEAEPSLRPEV